MSYKLPTASRAESMGICFVGQKRRFEKFLCEIYWLFYKVISILTLCSRWKADYLPVHRGPIIDIDTNKQIAVHEGLWQYTIGQRARISGLRNKMFVVAKDTEKNAIFIASGLYAIKRPI